MNLQNLIKNALIHGDGGFQVRMEREENRVLVRFSNAAPEGGVDPDRIFDRSGYEQRYSSDRALPYRETYLADRSEVASPLFRVLPCFLLLFHSIPEKEELMPSLELLFVYRQRAAFTRCSLAFLS